MKFNTFFTGLLLVLLAAGQGWCLADNVNWKKVSVLVYTKNGKGYVHDNIPNAVQCIQKLGQEHGFRVDVSDQPAVFTETNLKQYTLLIFPSTNNDVFDTDAQRLAFRRYIQAGGGFVGIHSATGTERNWKWFKQMVGCTFAWHPHFQLLKLRMIDATHPSMEGFPAELTKEDECYFGKEFYPGIRVLAAYDLTALDNRPDEVEKVKTLSGSFTDLYPAIWYQKFDGGTIWCTALGHHKKDYEDPTYVRHLFQGIRYVAGEVKKLDFGKAYADSRDTPRR